MRMPASKTSSFSVRDILDLGPKQAAVQDTGETQLAGIKTEPAPAPDIVKTAPAVSAPPLQPAPSTPPAPPRPGYLQGARPTFPFPHHWSQLSPFLAHSKCKIWALWLQMEYAFMHARRNPLQAHLIINTTFYSFQWTQ